MSGVINLDGVAGGHAAAPAAPWFDWSFDYREFSQIYPGVADTAPERPEPAKAAAPTLESDIAALVSAAAGTLRHVESAEPRAREAPLLRVVPSRHSEEVSADRSKFVGIRVNDFRPRAWLDIRPGDAVRAVATARGFRPTPKLRAVLALGLGLAIGWIAVLPLSYFRSYLAQAIDEPRPPAQVPRTDAAAARPPAGTEARRDAANSGKSTVPGHGRKFAQNTAPPKPIRTSLVAPAPDVTGADAARRGDFGARPLPFPETKPETLSGWTVREVYGGTAILDGPERSFKAARGDVVPGVGRLESIVRWGDRWIVATESGLISTP